MGPAEHEKRGPRPILNCKQTDTGTITDRNRLACLNAELAVSDCQFSGCCSMATENSSTWQWQVSDNDSNNLQHL